MMWHRLSLESCPDQPWANAAGVTKELLTWPKAKDWQIRISVATIDRSAPYSSLPGIQRWHTPFEGALKLSVNGKETLLDNASQPFAFPGDAPCRCELLLGPAKAFNVMARQSRGTQVLRLKNHKGKVSSLQSFLLSDGMFLFGVFAIEPASIKTVAQPRITLQKGDWAWLYPASQEVLQSLQIDGSDTIVVLF